jgi:uncharacterized SAM-binding protein YcdF (DUF218 family)
MKKNKRKSGKNIFNNFYSRFGYLGSIFLLLIVVTGGYFCLRALGAYLIISSELQPANAIVVLSGGDESRMKQALQLYNENYAKMIVLTETGQTTEGFTQLYSFDMRIVLLSHGIPSGNILITDRLVSSTRDEALAVKNLMISQQMKSAIIVTDPYHTRRAFNIFKENFADTDIQLSIQPVQSSWYNSRTWFLKIAGWKFTILEYIKLLADKLQIFVD